MEMDKTITVKKEGNYIRLREGKDVIAVYNIKKETYRRATKNFNLLRLWVLGYERGIKAVIKKIKKRIKELNKDLELDSMHYERITDELKNRISELEILLIAIP